MSSSTQWYTSNAASLLVGHAVLLCRIFRSTVLQYVVFMALRSAVLRRLLLRCDARLGFKSGETRSAVRYSMLFRRPDVKMSLECVPSLYYCVSYVFAFAVLVVAIARVGMSVMLSERGRRNPWALSRTQLVHSFWEALQKGSLEAFHSSLSNQVACACYLNYCCCCK